MARTIAKPGTDTDDGPRSRRGRLRLAPPRRLLPWLATGAALVLGCGVAGGVLVDQVAQRTSVLVLARAVPAGHVLSAPDLAEVEVAGLEELNPLPAEAATEVVGRSVIAPMPAGSLVTESTLGASAYPGPGEALVGVSLKPGQYPPGIAAGARVAIVITTETQDGLQARDPAARSVPGHVAAAVAQGEGEQALAVELRVASADAAVIADAAAAERVALIELQPR